MTRVHVYCPECIKPHHEVDCFLLQLVLLLVTEMLWVVGVIKGVVCVSYNNKGCIALQYNISLRVTRKRSKWWYLVLLVFAQDVLAREDVGIKKGNEET